MYHFGVILVRIMVGGLCRKRNGLGLSGFRFFAGLEFRLIRSQGLGTLVCRVLPIYISAEIAVSLMYGLQKKKETTISAHILHREHPRAAVAVPEPAFGLGIWGFPKIRGTFLWVPIIRTIVNWVYIGVPSFGKLPFMSWSNCEMRP